MLDIIGKISRKEQIKLDLKIRSILKEIEPYKSKIRRAYIKVKLDSDKYLYLNLRFFSRRDVLAGINSNFLTSNNKRHCFFSDLDMRSGVNESDIILDLKRVQKLYDLPDIHLYKSSNTGFFGISFTELKFDELWQILADLKYEDPNHRNFLGKNKFLTLRPSKKWEKPSSGVRFYKTLTRKSKTRRNLIGAKSVFDKILEEELDGTHNRGQV